MCAEDARVKGRHRREPEHVEQKALFYWAALHEARIPELAGLYAVPNGRGRSKAEAGKLKAEGVKPGVLDVGLDVARHGFHGLRIEMKAPGRIDDVSEDQAKWIERLRAEGYLADVFDHWQHAWNYLMDYLDRSGLYVDELPAELFARRSKRAAEDVERSDEGRLEREAASRVHRRSRGDRVT